MKKINPNYVTKTVENRLYHSTKAIIGITGSIGSGKSTFCQYLIQKGYAVIDADKLIKNIYRKDEVLQKIAHWVPEAVEGKSIDFRILRSKFYENKNLKMNIENLLYQFLPVEFADEAKLIDQDFIFYDVPLLFERHLQSKLDQSILVYAPYEICLERVINRDQIDRGLAEKMFAEQMPIEEKRKLADVIIHNDQNRSGQQWPEVDQLLAKIVSI